MTVTVTTMLRFGLGMAIVMGIIYILAVLTPKMAEKVDRFLEKHRTEKKNDRTDEVRGIYDLPRFPKNDESNSDSENKS